MPDPPSSTDFQRIMATIVNVHMPALLEFCYDRPDDLRVYPALAQRLGVALRREDVPLGLLP